VKAGQHASLPLLVADLADEGVRDFLEGVALASQVAFVPLLAAPVDRSTHALEVYSPDSATPLHLYADPVGPPTAEGFPLRLRFAADPPAPVAVRSSEVAATAKPARKRPTTLRARHETNHELSARHTSDLEGKPAPRKALGELVGRTLAGGKLEITAVIGGGGVGAVYRAEHRRLRMPVAVKVLHDTYQADADFGRRFHAEALAASRLDHPNITRVLDFGQEPDGLLYLVMEYLDGVGLRAVLDQEQRLDVERVLLLGSQVCAGLAHAHARSIVHKDVKPENLVIVQGANDDDGQPIEVVKVCDFGIAQGAVAEETRRFQGTPEYMSPEQCVNGELDARSDVYSFGIVLYELLTGDVPFTDPEVGRIIWNHLHEPPEAPSSRNAQVPPRLDAIVLRALAKKPADRFGSMRDLRAALRELLDQPPSSTSGRRAPTSAAPPEPPPLAATPGPELAYPSARPPPEAEPRAARPVPDLARPSAKPARLPEAPEPVRPSAARPAPDLARPSAKPATPSANPAGRMAGSMPTPAGEWLIRGGGYDEMAPRTSAAPSSTPQTSSSSSSSSALAAAQQAPPSAEVAALAADPAAFMRRLVATDDPRAFAELVLPLETAIPELVERRMIETLWRLASTLDVLATEGAETEGSRAATSKAILRILRDPSTLATVAQVVLASGDLAAERLIIAGGAFGAHALYSARIRQTDPEARARFTATLRALGADAHPILRGGLERLVDRLSDVRASQIAEDLLSVLPGSPDDALGAIVAAYARSSNPALVRLAVIALPALWRERSRAIILGLIEHADEAVAIASLRALAEIGISDAHTPRRIATVLDRSPRRSTRLAAVSTLSRGRGEARRVAAGLLEERLRATKVPATPEDADVALGLARGLLLVATDKGAAEVTLGETTKAWPDELRARTREL
jgi:serine/threonine protein kinase